MFCSRIEDWIVNQSYGPLVITFQWDDDFIFPPMLNAQIVLDCLGGCILLQDFDEGMLVVRLEQF